MVPVVNENDTVATAEIRFGDNDRLAALVAHLVGADALVLLSDVDALYTGDPAAAHPRARCARSPTPRAGGGVGIGRRLGQGSQDGLGTGGMASKLTAAMTATGAGIPVLLASAAKRRRRRCRSTRAGPRVGTAFAPRRPPDLARLFWLRHAATPAGALILDAGAVAAVVQRRKSLLPAGITGFRGDFESGDVVDLVGPDGVAVARGFVAHDAAELPAVIGRALADLPAEQRREVVHADDLVGLDSRLHWISRLVGTADDRPCRARPAVSDAGSTGGVGFAGSTG